MPGENHKSVSRDEGRSQPTEDWLATTIEMLELAAANPAVAPHSCSHCREWELDLNHKTMRHITPPSDGQAQSGFTTSFAREKAELGCAFFKRIVRTDILSPLTHRQRDEFIKLLDGADVFVSSSGMDSNPRLEVIWKNDKTHVAREIYEIYVPPGMPLHPAYTVSQEADEGRYPSLDWSFSEASSAQFDTQFKPQLPEDQELVGRLQLESRQVCI